METGLNAPEDEIIMLENSLPYDTSVDAPSMPLDAQLPTMESNEIQSL